MNPLRFAILTVSDRSARGERADTGGPALADWIRARGYTLRQQKVVPDDPDAIRNTLVEWATEDLADIVLTTGGTGFAPRDVTPEATLSIIDREAPGLAEAMRAASAKHSAHAMLSRARAGIRGRTLIVNLPGNPGAAVENLQVIAAALEHAVQLLTENPDAEAGHKKGVV
jgi:molybdenum cofactor synthesis domain-containing protein